MTIEEMAKAISDMQTIINNQNDTIKQMKESNDTKNNTITELMKLNNQMMLNVSGTSKIEEDEQQEEKLESKLLGEYAEHFSKEELSDFINTFEGE